MSDPKKFSGDPAAAERVQRRVGAVITITRRSNGHPQAPPLEMPYVAGETMFQLVERAGLGAVLLRDPASYAARRCYTSVLATHPDALVAEGSAHIAEPVGPLPSFADGPNALRWIDAHSKGRHLPWSERSLLGYMNSSTVDVARWALARGCPRHPRAAQAAAESGRKDLLEWALEEGFVLPPETTFLVARDGADCGVLEVAKEVLAARGEALAWHPHTMIAAATEANLVFARRALELGCPREGLGVAAEVARACGADMMFSDAQAEQYENFAAWAETRAAETH